MFYHLEYKINEISPSLFYIKEYKYNLKEIIIQTLKFAGNLY